jgi:peroxiredoxin
VSFVKRAEALVLGYDRNRLIRHSIAAAFILVVTGLFARQQLAGPEAGSAVVLGPADELNLEVGQPAPDFVLEARDASEPLRLSSYRGRVVVLNFWASWCGPCREEMPEFQAQHDRGGGTEGPVILAVNVLSLDARELAEAFVDEFGITFPVLFDATGDVAARYGVRGLPATFFIDRDGVVRRSTYGPVFGELLAEGIAAAERQSDAS